MSPRRGAPDQVRKRHDPTERQNPDCGASASNRRIDVLLPHGCQHRRKREVEECNKEDGYIRERDVVELGEPGEAARKSEEGATDDAVDLGNYIRQMTAITIV